MVTPESVLTKNDMGALVRDETGQQQSPVTNGSINIPEYRVEQREMEIFSGPGDHRDDHLPESILFSVRFLVVTLPTEYDAYQQLANKHTIATPPSMAYTPSQYPNLPLGWDSLSAAHHSTQTPNERMISKAASKRAEPTYSGTKC